MENVLLMVGDGPYGSIFAAEALRAGIAFSGMDLKTKLVFMDDGVFCLTKGQKPESFGMSGLEDGYKNAAEFGLELFVHTESLSKRGLREKDILQFKSVSDDGLRELIEEADTVIRM